jgi:hypothetical protein
VGLADPEYALVLPPGFLAGVLVNAAVMAIMAWAIDRVPPRRFLAGVVVPMVAPSLTTVLLAAVIVYAYAHVGPVALGLLVTLFFLDLWLPRQLLLSRERAEELDAHTQQLASLQVGVLTAMLKTLALRDRMTARHSAAVARYARELAREAGLTPGEQDLVHVAGLLHDIGKFILPDHILLAETKLGRASSRWRTPTTS